MSAPCLFVLLVVTLKLIVRKLFFVDSIRLSHSTDGVAIPGKMLLKQSSGCSVTEILSNCLGFVISTFYSGYRMYKAFKKYDELKYMISLTRNVSRLTGFFCSLWLPHPLRYVFYGGFAKMYGINMEEVEHPDFGHYETFTLFFTRRLKAGVRTVSEPEQPKSMCSPCDGRVLTCGKINSEFSTIDCVKGRSYRLDEFMLGTKGNTDSRD